MLAARAARGLPTPAWDSRPSLAEDLRSIWETFVALSQARSVDGWSGAQPISVTEIAAWLQMIGVSTPSAREEWATLIRFLDGEWLTVHRETESAKPKRQKEPSKRD